MSNPVDRRHRDTHADTSSIEQRLARLLDTPLLARVVPHLPPETLHQLIRHRGLEACGALVIAATPAQLTSVLDLELWPSPQPGRDEQFDADRFGEWLEMLAEAREAVAARTVAGIDADLVVAGLSRYVRAFDPGTFLPTVSSDELPPDFELPPFDGLECEIGGYTIRATRDEAWDAIVTLLAALDADQPDCFHAVMQGCRRLSNSTPEIDGLDDLLTTPEQQLHDVAIEREQRRSQRGYSTPADARAFLQMARQRRHQALDEASSVNPIAAAYFRAAADAEASTEEEAGQGRPAPESATDADASEALPAVLDLLAEAGFVPGRPRALLESAPGEPSRLTPLRALLASIHDADQAAFARRNRELAFLANTLVAGGSLQSRAFTPAEASDAAAGICNLGLEQWRAPLPERFLVDHDLVTAFETGWAVLHEEVTVFVAAELIAVLDDLRHADAGIQRGLDALRRELIRQRDAGTPWRARQALDVIATLDMPAWAGLLGLLDECPVLPLAVTATLEKRTRAFSPTAFEFITTGSQIHQVKDFMTALPDLLVR